MKITKSWLIKWSACSDGTEWLLTQKERDGTKIVKKLIEESKLDWANWTIARLLNKKKRIQYAIFAAEQAIKIFEKKYPDDKRPREAIEAAKKVLKADTKKNKEAAVDAAHAAHAAAHAAHAAADAAHAAADAAYAAARAAADAKTKTEILKYGLKLLGAKE